MVKNKIKLSLSTREAELLHDELLLSISNMSENRSFWDKEDFSERYAAIRDVRDKICNLLIKLYKENDA